MPPSPRGQEHVSEFPAVQIRERSAEIIQLLPNCQRHSATDRHQSHEPLIVPSGFEIQRLPLEVESFAFSIMQTIARSWSQKGNHHTNETTDIGDAGGLSSKIGAWEAMTSSSIQYPETRNSYYLPGDFSWPVECTTSTDRKNLLQNVRNQWYLFEMPLAAWHQRLGEVDGQAPSTSRTEFMAKDQ